jgi:hypothetical protein
MAHDMIHSAQYCQKKRANLVMSQKGSSPAKPDGLTYPLGTGPAQTQSSGPAQGKIMSLASKIGWAGIALTLLTTGMSLQAFPQSTAGSDSSKE